MAIGPLIVVSGPSASGKSTLIERLLAEQRWPLRLSVSATTRALRPGEIDGVHYHRRTPEQFALERASRGFLEWAQVHGNCYGTPWSEVTPYRDRGIGVILDIDTRGHEQVKRFCSDAVSVFLKASSEAEYERRLRGRGTETEEQIQRRLQAAKAEIAHAGEYNYQVVNDDLTTALDALRTIVGPLFERK
jgi:guanylate kinase